MGSSEHGCPLPEAHPRYFVPDDKNIGSEIQTFPDHVLKRFLELTSPLHLALGFLLNEGL